MSRDSETVRQVQQQVMAQTNKTLPAIHVANWGMLAALHSRGVVQELKEKPTGRLVFDSSGSEIELLPITMGLFINSKFEQEDESLVKRVQNEVCVHPVKHC